MLSSQPRPELYISYLRLGVLSPFALHQRSQASKVSYFFVFFPLASAIERFHSRGQQLLLDQKKTVTLKKSSTPWLAQDCFGTPIWPPWRHEKTLFCFMWCTMLISYLDLTLSFLWPWEIWVPDWCYTIYSIPADICGQRSSNWFCRFDITWFNIMFTSNLVPLCSEKKVHFLQHLFA